MRAFGRARLQPGQSKQRDDVRVIPLERDGEREDVEFVDRRLRFDADERRPVGQLRGQLRLRRQEHPLADDVVFSVEQLVDRLEAEVRHPDEVGVGKRERDAEPSAVRLRHVAHFFRENLAGPLTLLPDFHGD